MATEVVVSTSFMDKIRGFWNSFDIKELSSKIGGSSAQAVEAVLYFGLSFVIGFFFKKYFKILFISLVVAGFLVFALHYNNMLTIDWTAIKAFGGFGPEADIHIIVKSLGMQLVDWVKNNVLAAVAAAIGFLLGYMLG